MSNPSRQLSARRYPPLPGNHSNPTWKSRTRSAMSSQDESYPGGSRLSPPMRTMSPDVDSVNLVQTAVTYLASHHEVLEEFILEFIDSDRLEYWLHQKLPHSTTGTQRLTSAVPTFPNTYKECDIVNVQNSIQDRMKDQSNDRLPLMFELLNVLGSVIRADCCSLLIPMQGNKELHLYVPGESKGDYTLRRCSLVGRGSTIAAYVAEALEAVYLADIMEAATDSRFPDGIGAESILPESVLCAPVTLPSRDLICVMQFLRGTESQPFEERDLHAAIAMVTWIGSLLHQYQLNASMQTQTELNQFLLEVSKVIFDDTVAMDFLVQRIMTFTKKLVSADRCAMFLMDESKKELYCDLFDDGNEENGTPIFTKKKEIRFPITHGIAGLVARTAEIVNITDAYSDDRFNREVDNRTGYTTKHILCMPIVSKGAVIGVVEVVNKICGNAFTNADEESFKTFSVFCALALHYSKIYAEIQLRTARFEVALEQMSYHQRCSPEEHAKLMKKPFMRDATLPPNLDSFDYYGPEKHEAYLPQLFNEMMRRLCGPDCFDLETLCRFILTVRKNYRPLPYHNWDHGWTVAHCMYAILMSIKDRELFSVLRMKALVIACLCHDIDHRGCNNTFVTATSDPLAQLYGTSVMEEHHYASTVNILQQAGMGLFNDLTKEDYKEVMEVIRSTIIATDLALYFHNQKALNKHIVEGTFNLEDPQHLTSLTSLMTTAADLSGSTKNWHIQRDCASNIYNEFYDQGDKEKKMGLHPIAMMDRDLAMDMPKDQVGFINFICLPLYQTLAAILPETEPLLIGCKNNLVQWEALTAGPSGTLWTQEKSVITLAKVEKEPDTS